MTRQNRIFPGSAAVCPENPDCVKKSDSVRKTDTPAKGTPKTIANKGNSNLEFSLESGFRKSPVCSPNGVGSPVFWGAPWL